MCHGRANPRSRARSPSHDTGDWSRLEPALSVKLFCRWYKMRDTGRGMVNPIRRDNGVVGFDIASFPPMVFMDGLVAQR
jgi:hypothetical protein